MKSIKLGQIRIQVAEYAIQGNAILGIRDSGKSYTATCIAEQLLDAGIPFVAFDPIGVWKYLRVAGKGAGYPVVVAGGEHGDLPLTPQSAPEIVRAAMRENIPLVLDLYSMNLSKADWKRIVEQSVRLLLYENGRHGLRHLFIEEAAEFTPQRVGPDQGAVYAEIEKLARMGGNAQLGYTLINQRAEEVNKAVLELCDCLFLHRQKGRNSLTALGKWLDIADATQARDIVKSLPGLGQGECWVWGAGSDTPVRVRVPEKRTYHPDRRAIRTQTQNAVRQAVDVTTFVARMSDTLQKVLESAKADDPRELRRRIAELEKSLARLQAEKLTARVERIEVPVFKDGEVDRLERLLESFVQRGGEFVQTVHGMGVAAGLKAAVHAAAQGRNMPAPKTLANHPWPASDGNSTPNAQIAKGARRMLEVLAQRHPLKLTRAQLGTLAGFTPSGGTFGNYFGALKRAGYLAESGAGDVEITGSGLSAVGSDVPPKPETTSDVIALWKDRLPAGAGRMLDVLVAEYPRALSRLDLGERTGFTASGGTFGNYLGLLRRNGLADVQGELVLAGTALFEARHTEDATRSWSGR